MYNLSTNELAAVDAISEGRMKYWMMFFMRNMSRGYLRKYKNSNGRLYWLPISMAGRANIGAYSLLLVLSDEVKFVQLMVDFAVYRKKKYLEEKQMYEEEYWDDGEEYPQFTLMDRSLYYDLALENKFQIRNQKEADAMIQ